MTARSLEQQNETFYGFVTRVTRSGVEHSFFEHTTYNRYKSRGGYANAGCRNAVRISVVRTDF